MPEVPSLRVDKWLWATRFFKTRSLAAEACKASRVRRVGALLKPSSLLKAGDEIALSVPHLVRVLRVESLPPRRVSAKIAVACYTELTTPEAEEEARRAREMTRAATPAGGKRPAGAGRPTKYERREIDKVRKALRDMGYGREE